MRLFAMFLGLLALTTPISAQNNRAVSAPYTSKTANELLNDYLHEGVAQRQQVAAAYARSGIDYCDFLDRASGNSEIETASMRGKSADLNLADSAAQGYATTSIIQFECGPHSPAKPATLGGLGMRVWQTDGSSAPNLTPGYAVMARWKGRFTESVAPRRLTVLPGYGQDKATAIQQMGTEEWKRELVEQSRKVAASYTWIPPTKLNPESLKNMSPEEVQRALIKDGQQRMQEAQRNMANMSLAEQQQAIQSFGQTYAEVMNSPMGRNMSAAMLLTGITGPPVAGGVEPLAFLNLLRPNESLVDAYKFRVRDGDGFGAEHYLLAISQSVASRRFVDLGPADPIDSAIKSFYKSFYYLRNSEDWRALQRLIVQPIVAALPSGTKEILLSPDSSLALVPFASLMLDMGVPATVSIVPSAYDFARLRDGAAPPAGKRVLVIGDLSYGEGKTNFLPLPGTKHEMERVAELAAGAGFQAVTLSGSQATRAAILDKIREIPLLHFATHGFWASPTSANASEAFRSAGVALSLANSGSPESLLTAEDILHLDLTGVQLITLSACESGKGQPIEGQGLLGFQTAFMAAGARSVLLSLWSVPDEATSQLMEEFYSALWRKPSISKAEALRHAQQQIRSNRKFASPVNWAAWVLVGDGR